MATTTPKPTEGSPTGDSAGDKGIESSREHIAMQDGSTATVTPTQRQVPGEHQAMDEDTELARLARYAEQYSPPPWTPRRIIKLLIYFLIMTALTFVFLVLMQGVAHTDDRTSVSDVERWIEDGLVGYRSRNQSSGDTSEATRVPAADTPETPIEAPRDDVLPAPEPQPAPPATPVTPVNSRALPDQKSSKQPNAATESAIEKVARSLPPLELKGIGAVENDALPWMQTMDLALSLEIEFKDKPPMVDARVLRSQLYHELIDLSVRVGHTDNPYENLEAIRGYMAQKLGLTPVLRDVYPLEMTRPGVVLSSRRGSPRSLAILGLILADRINPYLELEPVTVGSVLGLRYRSGDHRYTLVLRDLSRLYGDRELIEYALGKDALGDVKVLSRRQFWGSVFTEVGSSLLDAGEVPRATSLIARGLALDHEYPLAHVATARVLLRNNELESAREELDLAVRLDPASTSVRLARFQLLGKHGNSETVENDLVWLTRNGSDPETGLWLAKHLLNESRFRDAMREIERVEARAHLSPALKSKVESLHERVLAGPWVAILADTSRSQRMRFEALERLREHPLPEVLQVLARTLADENLRLARLSWKLLEELTNWALPFDSATWLAALERESRLNPAPSH